MDLYGICKTALQFFKKEKYGSELLRVHFVLKLRCAVVSS